MYLFRGIQSEFIKLKRSLVLYISLLIPFFPAFANGADALKHGMSTIIDQPNLAPWLVFFQYANKFWTIFALPMVVALISAFLANTDHRSKTWKMLFSLSFPRWAVYAGKWFTLAGLVFLSNAIFSLLSVLSGVLVNLVNTKLGLGPSIPIGEIIGGTLMTWLLSLLMISIHLWVSLRWSSFLVSIIIGFAATVSNLFLISSYLFERSAISPWAMPVQAFGDWAGSLPAALVGAAVVFFLGLRNFTRRDVM